MQELIRAAGPAAAALRRYDRNLDIRYSWERRKWAVTVRTRLKGMVPPPVRYERVGGIFVTHLLPEKSERYISFHTKTIAVAYVDHVTTSVVDQIVASDSWRRGNSATRRVREVEEARVRGATTDKKARSREARKFLSFMHRRDPMCPL